MQGSYNSIGFGTVFLLIALAIIQVPFAFTTAGNTPNREKWGYTEVRPGAFTFWWLFYTRATPNFQQKPLILWIQGGPGTSGTGFGNLFEVGPLDMELKPRSHSWVNFVNILFVDSPVGTGFSYVTDDKLLSTTNLEVVADLITFLRTFLNQQPEFQSAPFYVVGESYGGNFAILLTQLLSQEIQHGTIKCNLKGVTLLSAWTSPIDFAVNRAPFLYATSVIDSVGLSTLNSAAAKVEQAVRAGQWIDAFNLYKKAQLLSSGLRSNLNSYNILQVDNNSQIRSQLATLMNGPIRDKLKIIPVGLVWVMFNQTVFDTMAGDFMKPVVSSVEDLLTNTVVQVVVFNGQLDLVCNMMGAEQWIDNMKWSGLENWKAARRVPIVLGNSTEAFVKRFGKFSVYWVLKAGHMVPADNPEMGIELLHYITNKKQPPS